MGAPLPAPRALPPLPATSARRASPYPRARRWGIVRNDRILAGGERAGAGAPRSFPSRTRRRLRRGAQPARSRRHEPPLGRSEVRHAVRAPRVDRETRARLEAHPAALRAFQNELLWREFAHQLLWERPELLTAAVPPEASSASRGARTTTRCGRGSSGETGYPVVDAAARQLLGEGFVHNRARMICGELSHQAPARRLPARRGALPEVPDRRRLGAERRRLAVERRVRVRRAALLPRLQPGHAGQDVRSRRGLRAPLGARAGARCPRRTSTRRGRRPPTCCERPAWSSEDLPEAHRRPRVRARPLPGDGQGAPRRRPDASRRKFGLRPAFAKVPPWD